MGHKEKSSLYIMEFFFSIFCPENNTSSERLHICKNESCIHHVSTDVYK